MRKTLILILLVSSFKLVAQHQDLQQIWYVESLTVNGVTTEIPNDPIEFPFAYIRFLPGSTGYVGSRNHQIPSIDCKIGFTGHVNYTSDNIFEFLDFTAVQDVANCSAEIVDFMSLYVGFYEAYVTEQFIYSITTEIDNSKTLLVTNLNGDTVTYTNVFFNSAPQELSSNTWYLHNLIIDGDDNIPPNNTELSEITLGFNNEIFSTEACSSINGNNYFNISSSQFYLYGIGGNYGLIFCDPTNYPENNTFTDLYIRDFYLNNLPGPFSYEYTINGSTKTLTITNALGNQAVYSNFTLSTQEFTNSIFLIYPNPVKEFINIEVSNNEKILQVSVYNLLGKKIISTTENSINLSKYENGIYFVKILTKNGSNTTKKIIKIGA